MKGQHRERDRAEASTIPAVHYLADIHSEMDMVMLCAKLHETMLSVFFAHFA